jgi:hypothetical protein
MPEASDRTELWVPMPRGHAPTPGRDLPRRGAGPEVELFHASGKWSRTGTPAFHADVLRMRRLATAGTRTEATAQDFGREASWPGDGWGLWHPRRLGRDCAVEWDAEVWRHLDHGVLQLTDIVIHTEGGAAKLPCALTWALLEHRETGVELELGGAHLDLDNTPLRRRANLEECRALRAHYQRSRRRHPQRRHALQFDGNRDQRDHVWVGYFQRNLLAGTGLESGWRTLPAKGGTHGRRAILDLSATDWGGRTELLPDDAASDHRPILTAGRL